MTSPALGGTVKGSGYEQSYPPTCSFLGWAVNKAQDVCWVSEGQRPQPRVKVHKALHCGLSWT